MDAKRVTIVGIIAILAGLPIGWLFKGYQTTQLERELAAAKAKVAEAQKAGSQEAALTAKLQALEGQFKQVAERLAAEKAQREKLEAQVAEGQK